MESGAATAKKTTKCCGLLVKASIESTTETDIARRRGSIKQSGIISNFKPQDAVGEVKKHSAPSNTNIDPDDSSGESNSQQQLIGGLTAISASGVGHIVKISTSPKVMSSARNKQGREPTLKFGQQEDRSMIQSQEGALNVVPRPRFKINEGADQAESILSHFSQSEIIATEGLDATNNAVGA